MKKSEILNRLASHLDAERLLDEYPQLGRDTLAGLLKEAAQALGPAVIEPPGHGPRKPHAHKAGRLVIHTDGASRGNPGEAGIGALIEDDTGHVVGRLARYLGRTTNNQAEYAALIDALKEAARQGAKEVSVYADSELVVKQVKGEYRVKNPDLKPMHAEVMRLISGFDGFAIKYIPREKNKEADALANEAIDKRLRP